MNGLIKYSKYIFNERNQNEQHHLQCFTIKT